MASNVKKDRKVTLFSRIAIVFCLIAALLAITICTSNPSYNAEHSTTVKIKSGDDIAKRGVSLYNDNIVLENDITISSDDALIGSSEFPFEGVFDGNGHTVRLNYGNASDIASLFGYIAKEAEIKNVTFVFDNITISSSYFGGIARVNDGTIKNCKIEYENLKITGAGIFSPLVTINNGVISDAFISGSVSGNMSYSDEERVLFGSACVYNNGTITRIISDTTFSGFLSTDANNIRIGNAKNFGICAIRYMDTDDGKLLKAAAVTKDNQVCYEKSPGKNDASVEFIAAQDLYKYEKIFTVIGFDDEVWELTDSTLEIK